MTTTGLEALLRDPPPWIQGRRFGLLCNQASVDKSYRHAKDLLASRFPGQLTCLFSPQHGLQAEKQDNMVESPHGWDAGLGIPVFSLYAENRSPSSCQLDELDLVLVDLQDVGCRVYTYIWTLLLLMDACACRGKGVAILDRPNPIGGAKVEGNLLDPGLFSFVGHAAIPMRHGMTMGELAGFLASDKGLDLELHVVRLEGWQREWDFSLTGLPWVWPSPNMPTLDTARVYPGQVVLEGTCLSEGRGTTRPFEVFGAPFLDLAGIRADFERMGLAGCVLRDQCFEPTFQKWQGNRCRGFQIHVTDFGLYEPYVTTLALLSSIKRRHPEDFFWRDPPYEYEFTRLPADLIIGDRRVREAVESGAGPNELRSLWQEGLKEFAARRERFFLY